MPTWQSPTAIQADCGATDTAKLIDGDTSGSSVAYHYAMGLHYVVFDLGQNYSVTGVRCFTNAIIQSHHIYVSGDTSFTDGEIVFTDYCFPNMSNDWAEKTFTAKTGRYIKFELYRTGACTTSNWQWAISAFYEFEGYCASVSAGNPRSYGYLF
jgi:hypothetical protein